MSINEKLQQFKEYPDSECAWKEFDSHICKISIPNFCEISKNEEPEFASVKQPELEDEGEKSEEEQFISSLQTDSTDILNGELPAVESSDDSDQLQEEYVHPSQDIVGKQSQYPKFELYPSILNDMQPLGARLWTLEL